MIFDISALSFNTYFKSKSIMNKSVYGAVCIEGYLRIGLNGPFQPNEVYLIDEGKKIIECIA